MRPSLSLFAAWIAAAALCHGQDKPVQSFDGTSAQDTPVFQVQDKWEVRWDSADVTQITVLAPDGTVVAGAAGSQKGSLYLPKGGTFSLKISRAAAVASPWHIAVVEVGSAPDLAAVASNYFPPETLPVAATTNSATAASPPSTAAAQTNASPAVPVILGSDQARAVVVIKGDSGEGTGFLVKTADGPAVVTNVHVLSANPNVKVLTTTGAQIKLLGLKGASDRDLAMISIEDDHYAYLDLATDIAGTVQVGDEVITPGNSEGGEVVLNTKGTILGIGPQMIEFSNPVYHGNSGGPVLHTKSGKVLAAVEGAHKVTPTDDLDKASFASKDSAITASMRYFGLRLDNVPRWEPYDWNRFLNETTFIRDFHDLSRCLDSYMNGAAYERARVASTEENGRPDARYYLKNQKLQTVHDNYHHLSTDADASQKLDATREMIMDMQGIAGTDMDAIQNPNNFYSFDQIRIGYEIKYRKALEKEIESYGDKISDMGH